MDWINCNICCCQPGDEKDKIFMLSSCGHIFCNLCLQKVESKDKCTVCSISCQFIHLTSKMKSDTQIFFQEPTSLAAQQYKQLTKVLEFQKEHRSRLITFHRKIIMKFKGYKELEQKYRHAMERIDDLERENYKLKTSLNSANMGGGSEYGDTLKGDYSTISHYSTPHESYQRAICASGNRNSPQVSGSFTSPGSPHISPGRLTLIKGPNNQGKSPGNKLMSQNICYTSPQQMLFKGPSQTNEIVRHQSPQINMHPNVHAESIYASPDAMDIRRNSSEIRNSNTNIPSSSMGYHSNGASNHIPSSSMGYHSNSASNHIPSSSMGNLHSLQRHPLYPQHGINLSNVQGSTLDPSINFSMQKARQSSIINPKLYKY